MPSGHIHTASDISNATTTGRNLITATDAAAARGVIGLSNVDNTSDASKPISTATQAALNAKASQADLTSGLAGKANTGHTHTIANVSGLQAALETKVNIGDIIPEIYWDNTTSGWPARSVPAGYSGWVVWDSAPYEAVTAPPAAVQGDRWRRFYSS